MPTASNDIITLCMIIKNEAHIIKELLENVYKYIDNYVIVDTGSSDNSQTIVRDFFDSRNIKGDVIDHEYRNCRCHGEEYKRYQFFHFGWARSYAMRQCAGKGTYILVIDADDLIMNDFKYPEPMTHDCYSLTYGKGFTYQRCQLFKNDPELDWHYEDALHEYPKCAKRNHTTGYIKGDYYIDSRRLGSRSSDPLKYLRDAQVFEELLLEKPDNDRYLFYCGQSFYDYKDYHSAIKKYKRRIEVGGWIEERLFAAVKIGMAMEELQMPWPECEKAYMDAYNLYKIRGAEPLFNIAYHYRKVGDYKSGYAFAKKGMAIPYPEKCVLFVYEDIYKYRIANEVALCAFQLGKYHESLCICEKLILSGVVPEHDLPGIKENMRLSKQKLDEKEKKICCVYLGNEILSIDTPLTRLLDYMTKAYKVFVIGNKIDPYNLNNVIVINNSEFKLIEKDIQVEHLIIYNSLNYFYDNLPIKSNSVILLQNDHLIKLLLNNGSYLAIFNSDHLNTLFPKINKIMCASKKIRNRLATEYRLSNETVGEFDILNETDCYLVFEDLICKYKFKLPILNETNGYGYQEPSSIKLLKDNKAIYPFSKPLLVKYQEDIIKQFPTMPEHIFSLAVLYIDYGEYQLAQNHLDSALNLIKNNKAYDSYRDVILIAKSKILNKLEKYQDAYNLADEVLRRDLLPEALRVASEDIRDINVDYIKDSYLFVSPNRAKSLITNLKTKTNKKLLLSMTTCKRFDLFEKTVNSFLNCCTDIDKIDHWLCVDDNSSQEDRNKMKKQYPFFEFIWKDETQKGHYTSMNIIRKYALDNNVEYLLHMEDDFHFVQKRDYIADCMRIFNESPKIGQVLFNINYAEVELSKRKCRGGHLKKCKDGSRYYIHEHYDTSSKEYHAFTERHKGHGTCGYWPHFSFRPSIVKTEVYKQLGSFFNTAHFEMQYANEYVARGYVSAFFDSFCCIHTGKKTWENNGINSYHLNKTGQFTLTNDELYVNVISNQNIEEWKTFKESAVDKLPYFIRVLPKKIGGLNDFERKAFYGNKFNYLRSIISPIANNLNLLRENKSKHMMILKHNIVISPNFVTSFSGLLDRINATPYDIVLLDNAEIDKKDILIEKSIKVNLETSHGFIISKSGIQKILDHIEMNRIHNTNYLDNISDFKVYKTNRQLYTINPTQEIKQDTEFYKLEGYTFYSQQDSYGGDIKCVGLKTIEEYKAICEEEKGVCFNTLGFIKDKVETEETFIYLPNSTKACQGLYVKNSLV